MVIDDKRSVLSPHGFKFRNWPNSGEEAADFFGLSHAVVIPNGASRVLIGGQVGIRDDDTVPADLGKEIEEVFEHIGEALRSAGVGSSKGDAWEYIVKVWCFLSEANHSTNHAKLHADKLLPDSNTRTRRSSHPNCSTVSEGN